MLATQHEQLRSLLLRDESESAALALCGRSQVPDPWDGGIDERFVIREVIPVPDDAYTERTPTGFSWSTAPFYHSLKRAEAKDLAIAVFHSHPAGNLVFSDRDDSSDDSLFSLAFNRLESRKPHLSVIMDSNGDFAARAFGPDLKARPVEKFVTIGEGWNLRNSHYASDDIPELDRQRRAFGAETSRHLRELRIGIVGLGGTGSAVAMLLSRIGVGRIALIDRDHLDDSNLGRLHFSSRPDASLRLRKVDVVARGIAQIGLPVRIVTVPEDNTQPESLSVLRSCDLIFGCSDDHLGREILNRIAHFYFIPIIDLGLLIEPDGEGGYTTFDGRVTVIQPGYVCQTCRGLIDEKTMFLESLRRDPDVHEAHRRAGYIPNNPDPNPVVVSFTTEVATMAVNELFHRLNGFRGEEQRASERVRSFRYLKDSDTLPKGLSRPTCKICGTRDYDGRGDMNPLLDLVL
jgi:molybdopterin/thiamine biosynthesis adenylyltransferase